MKFKTEYDVIVIGGGPGGCVAAQYAAGGGSSVLLLERHREIGVPVRCAEAAGAAGLLEFFDHDHWIIRKYIKKFRIRFVSPNGTVLDLNHNSEAAVLDRKIFDHELGRMASEAGAQIVTGANATGLLIDNGHVKGVTFEYCGKKISVRCKVVIGADGIESRTGRWSGIDTTPDFSDMESCVQYTVFHDSIEKDRLVFYFGRDVAPTGYLWVFPKNDGTANVGLGVNGPHSKKRKAMSYLDSFVNSKYPKVSVLNRTCGGVVCSQTLERISGNGFMLVGDAAHQTNAVSGGGIVNAMKAGRIAGKVSAAAVKKGDTCADSLSEYDREWYRVQGKMNKKFYKIKRIIDNISDETLDDIAKKMSEKPEKKRTLVNIFKYALIGNPGLILELPKLFS